jgi:hypothetical protein
MSKLENKSNKSIKNQILSGIIITIFICGAGCANNLTNINGTFAKDDATTLEIREDLTFTFTERQGYLMGREINMSVSGTYVRDGDIVIFSGDGVTTTAHIQGDTLIIEGDQYTRIKL